MFIISKAGMKFGYREMMQMPARRFRRFYDIAVEFFESQDKARKKAEADAEAEKENQ